ncbi:mitochondrial thiamine pyrophosphate carrier-like [Hyposmocoma kahamanoa]|uniref:mitochondrial thiamine pyrophosphate carrier-like n=1 Tax=Hyposmocoma kahamanoa TaxID=1477025 RepID=UPI000E6D9360|nr:mitochondrial thiamine pyrophosphate carrier-like [Hyposmocoma kahamanoa]
MVGYDKDESLTPDQKLIASLFSGVITRAMTNPLDVVKVRAQLEKKAISNPNRKWFQITRKIIEETGVKSLWRGHQVGQIHSILGVTTQFYVYEVTTRLVDMNFETGKYSSLVHFLCGVFSGCMAATVVHPLEVIKVRQMINKEATRNLIEGAKKVYSTGGILSFYEGLSAAIVQIGPQVGISFAVFRLVQSFMLTLLTRDCDNREVCQTQQDHAVNVATASAIAGSMAGITSKSLTYPFELAKKRLQIKTFPSQGDSMFKCHSLIECLVKTFELEGFKGLFRGFKITIYKAQLSGLVAFTTYELICYATRQIIGPPTSPPSTKKKH